MIALLSPVALVGLVALAVPVVIHLQRRQERQVVDFAALRWLQRGAVPREQWRWQERWLMVLRMALIAATVLLLARPVWRGADAGGAPPWVAVSPEVPLAAARAAVVAPQARWHWLAPGWPGVDTPPPSSRAGDWASLVRDLDATLPAATPLTLVVPDRLEAPADAALALRRRVAWRTVPTADAATPTPPPRLHVAFRAASPDGGELAVAWALVRAWQVAAPSLGWTVPQADADAPAGDSASPIDADVAFTFWLGGAPSPALDAWVAAGGTVLTTGRPCTDGSLPVRGGDGREVRSDAVFSPLLASADGTPWIVEQARGRGRWLCLATALTPQATPALRDPATPGKLLASVVAGRRRPGPPMRVDAGSLAPRTPPGPSRQAPGRPLDPLLVATIAALFLVERWWATRPGRLAP